MSFNKNRNKRKRRKIRGVPIHITQMSVDSYHRLSNWVPNQSLDKVYQPNDTICQRSNLNIYGNMRNKIKMVEQI